ncbi:PAS domain S-box-containing protein [Desulfonispora thiosulfatigenes DSM 11270]|uniref:histidine kinase n=1 Tax=Desulfonispora thiosulfatigenes DSM 11270 TaxID=656914 RepID=A0A1W1VTL8_DESTI|nr:PAS domain-containing sensor histidine kinase [Desulfonispora thiosulfatigenes]SMB96580.1 PAS domain S-box-containing protein [Desulfonispora thiosulfatigenes DSM 11270]
MKQENIFENHIFGTTLNQLNHHSNNTFNNIYEILPRMLIDFIENQPQPVIMGYPSGKIVYCTDNFCEMLGYSKKELEGLRWDVHLTPPEWYLQDLKKLKDLDTNQKTVKYKKELFHKNGNRVTVEVNSNILKIAEDQSLYYCFLNNITKQEELENDLKSRRKLLDEILKSCTKEVFNANRQIELEVTKNKRLLIDFERFVNLSPDIFCAIDREGYLKQVNNTVEKVLGYKKEDVINKNVRQVLHEQDLDVTMQKLQMATTDLEYNYNIVNRFYCKDGTYKWIEWRGIYIASEGLHYYVGRDITERKRVENEMIRMEQLNLVGQIAAGLGHEVRNPLTTIRGFLQIMGKKAVVNEYKDYFKLMIDELDRANDIITEFLSIAKNNIRKREKGNLNQVIRALEPLIKADAIRQDKYIETDLKEIPDLLLDQKEMRQLILNLVRNGLEALPDGGIVSIKTNQSPKGVQLFIKDDGIGIPEEILNKLGTPFFTTKKNGTGLGLATCYSIAKAHDATIHIDTSEKGTTFNIIFKIIN